MHVSLDHDPRKTWVPPAIVHVVAQARGHALETVMLLAIVGLGAVFGASLGQAGVCRYVEPDSLASALWRYPAFALCEGVFSLMTVIPAVIVFASGLLFWHHRGEY
jgi:hypothetical protein